MSSQAPRPSAPPEPPGPFPIENRPGPAVDFPQTQDHSAVAISRLRDHLLRAHGRTGRETEGLPLADLHRFEHVEQSMGLNGLSHHHQ
jgi:hypothetical protein